VGWRRAATECFPDPKKVRGFVKETVGNLLINQRPIRKNPLGVYVNSINWSKELG
jgi:type IV secretory pathway TrbF-like protein